MNKTATLMTVAVLAGVTTTATADSVNYIATETTAGTWEIFVDITGGDSGGIGAYGFNVNDLGDNSTTAWAENTLTTSVFDGTTLSNVGYVSAPLTSTIGTTGFSIANSQTGSTNPVFGIGVSPIFVDGFDVTNSPDINLNDPALLGVLTTEAGLDASNFDFTATIFNNTGQGGFSNLLPENEFVITSTVTPIPEPSSLALLGLGSLLIARRRRG